MWADNETEVDLLGFDVLVDELVVALTTPELLPLTVGVLGGWGSGKSSLLKIARRELEREEHERYLCVEFSPWQYEDYDDVKAALMRAVLDKCHARASDDETREEVSKLRRFTMRFRSRTRVVARTAIMAVPSVVPVVMTAIDPSLADPTLIAAGQGVAQAVAPVISGALTESPSMPKPGVEIDDLNEFRRQFATMIDQLEGVEALIVFVDDLDRCLPETVVDTFEAIRLFLSTPKTAYVVAASREIVENAIDSRYPDLRRDDGAGIGHDYLEKMLQLQVVVPPLSASEIETYLNLLLTQHHIAHEAFVELLSALRTQRAKFPFPPAYNHSMASETLGDKMTVGLSSDIAWASEISPALAGGLRGNPRQIKRFLNDLTWRRRAAQRRGVELRHDVLAKLMVLEEQSGQDFQTLFDWQLRSDGPSPELVAAETQSRKPAASAPGPTAPETPRAVRSGKAAKVAKTATKESAITPQPADQDSAESEWGPVAAVASSWVSRPRTRKWLQLSPDLRDVDLRPYFSYFRDRLVVGSVAAALTPKLQALLVRLTAESALVYRAAISDVERLPESDQDLLVEAMLDAVARRPDGTAVLPLCELAKRVPRTGSVVCEGLAAIPHQILPQIKVVSILNRLKDAPGWAELVDAWSASKIPAVARSADAARTRSGS